MGGGPRRERALLSHAGAVFFAGWWGQVAGGTNDGDIIDQEKEQTRVIGRTFLQVIQMHISKKCIHSTKARFDAVQDIILAEVIS